MLCLMASVCGMWSVWNVGEGAGVLLQPAHMGWINMGKESGRSARGREVTMATKDHPLHILTAASLICRESEALSLNRMGKCCSRSYRNSPGFDHKNTASVVLDLHQLLWVSLRPSPISYF
ncbi:hypothetical protein AOLI_G00148530 [Acnodon oligacanthus]